MKKALVLGMIILLGGAIYFFPKLMVNPGQLAVAHQAEENKCVSCHEPFWGISNKRCISCHSLSGIDSIMNDSVKRYIGFHQQLGNTSCVNCHTDHMGAKADITYGHFDHSVLSAIVVSKCNSCHAKPEDDVHLQLTVDCKSCHTTASWSIRKNFDHNNLAVSVRNNCNPCHGTPSDDYHASVGNNCSQCHSTAGWVPSTFNHSQYFVLDRDHNARCNTCHTGGNLKIYTCYNCHEHSESRIREKHEEEGISNFTDCARCHTSGDEHESKGRKRDHDDNDD